MGKKQLTSILLPLKKHKKVLVILRELFQVSPHYPSSDFNKRPPQWKTHLEHAPKRLINPPKAFIVKKPQNPCAPYHQRDTSLLNLAYLVVIFYLLRPTGWKSPPNFSTPTIGPLSNPREKLALQQINQEDSYLSIS